ncbi:hypothetical protein CsSME_00053509 [Camellia sinensis var. sinensis]
MRKGGKQYPEKQAPCARLSIVSFCFTSILVLNCKAKEKRKCRASEFVSTSVSSETTFRVYLFKSCQCSEPGTALTLMNDACLGCLARKSTGMPRLASETKIRLFLALKIVQKWEHNRLINHAKMGTKERYNDKWHMEVPNSDEPFLNVEEGLKISLFTVPAKNERKPMQNECSGAKTRSLGPRKLPVKHRKWHSATKWVSQTPVSLKREKRNRENRVWFANRGKAQKRVRKSGGFAPLFPGGMLRQHMSSPGPFFPWAPLDDGLRFQYAEGLGTSQYRVLLEGPVDRAWFLGECFLRQVWGYNSQDPPAAPPVSMRTADRLSHQEVVGAMLGSDALLHLEEGDYATYRHTYLMPPLTGVRTPMTRSTGTPSSSQARARAADAPSTSRYGTTSSTPIPLEPPMPGDRYAIDPDSPLPPREYVEEVIELVASLEGMVLRREAQLSIAGIQPPARPPGPPWGAGPSGPFHGAGPSRPFRGVRPSRPFRGARGRSSRRRRAHVVEVEPDEEEEEEVTDRQLETSAEEGDSGLGSGSGDEAERDPEDDSSDPDDDGDAEVGAGRPVLWRGREWPASFEKENGRPARKGGRPATYPCSRPIFDTCPPE